MENTRPFKITPPEERWRPAPAQLSVEESPKLLPPLVAETRRLVHEWRTSGYPGASRTTLALIEYWFETEHRIPGTENYFQFYFAQREAFESIAYLYEVKQYRDKFNMIRLNAAGMVSHGMFDEDWARYVIKMATGTGKTKVLGLVLVWSYFHKLYEANSPLSANFLLISPNIIVLNRLLKDFRGLKYFFEDPFLPPDGYRDNNWTEDFQPSLHIQDEVGPISDRGNIFLTNIHRIYVGDEQKPSKEEMFLGMKVKPNADTGGNLDLGKLLRSDRLQDLVVLNDEAHHVHDKSLAWFQAIEAIYDRFTQRGVPGLRMQVDVSATPKHDDGAIFVQTIADYPLVEAINHNVVKIPVLPDEASRNRVKERDSNDFAERYRDHLQLGYVEWEKQYQVLKKHKTPLLFIMTMTTKEADEAKQFLETNYPLMRGKVLSIHTNKDGSISESKSAKNLAVLDELRQAADAVDSDDSPYRAVTSVMMLREGWDVRNVTTIVGLRPYSSKAKILPEQAIGRGLRKMFPLDVEENLVVVGTSGFIRFIEDLKDQGITFRKADLGRPGTRGLAPLIVEIDDHKTSEELHELDIPLPVLEPRIVRDYEQLSKLSIEGLSHPIATMQDFVGDVREIVFKNFHGEFSHLTELPDFVPNWRNVLQFHTDAILRSNRLFSGFDILYPKVEAFARHQLFGKTVDPLDNDVLVNLSNPGVQKIVHDVFNTAITRLVITDKQTTALQGYRSLLEARPVAKAFEPFVTSKKSVFNITLGDNDMEKGFAALCEDFPDVKAYAKNTLGQGGINFHVEYQNAKGGISRFYPDFLVKLTDNRTIYIAETKGRADADDRRKIIRLVKWCRDVNALQSDYRYEPLYVTWDDWVDYSNRATRFQHLIDTHYADTVALVPE
ncbi:DEAD/DEAH box helicase family protein [Neolewinella lacunae]|uniref:DEAD/DEAH box helicase family protein n=1 Tax=Neolewinella lacunae TaxID=1517758 RepID=A0A923PQ64_9BACT|nr:DEAD/DEAH box helicase family protein [Neolewinella lacunae]MBC6995761.1 DEAD/DEAH box helicase family protein [Neolewinella lacunae]MDN3636546.1 DEAD/DEAH box helicase family protein [Neolewinella lacunae]